ncbi:copper transporter MctB [Aeromicrobium halocynthiae]|uniref:Copper transporter MctB n=1 Tax=Aeromicrobium halocynthiae TaxID=560557 RepID=A0ABN2VRW1_9ACTN
MISFRYHLVSVAAVFVALSLGLVLGSGYLAQSVSTAGGGGQDGDEGLTSFEDGFAARTVPGLVDGTLEDRTVVVLTMPSARAEEVDPLVETLEAAGATVTGRGALSSTLVDPANRQFAESVAEESATDVESVTAAGDAYTRVGAALARSVVGEGARDDQARTISSAFVEGELLSWESEPSDAADLVVVVAGPGRSGDAASALGPMLTAIDSASTATLLAGPSRSSLDGGLVAAIRDSDVAGEISTVDVLDTAAGRGVATLALARAAADDNGDWGTDRSADGAVPQS